MDNIKNNITYDEKNDSDDNLTDDETLREEAINEIPKTCVTCIGNGLPLHLPILKRRRAFLYRENIEIECDTCHKKKYIFIYY